MNVLMNKKLHSIKNAKMNVFSFGWYIYIIFTVIILFVLFKLKNQLDYDTKRNIILKLSIFEYILLRIYKRSLKSVYDEYNYFNELPCYLCNQSTILCIIAALTGNSILMSFCTTIGAIGCLLALLMPDKYYIDRPFFSRQTYGFYGYHCLLLISCLSFYLLGLYIPNPNDTLWCLIIHLILGLISHLTNTILRKTKLNPTSNYTFTYEPENETLEMFYKLFPVRYFYLVPVAVLLSLSGYLFLWVLRIINI